MSKLPLILIVEDDRPVRSLISMALKSRGYQQEAVSNGQEAVLAMTGHPPDILILDLGLPDMDGNDIIKMVREWSQLPIIVVSARSDERDKIDALDYGADDYLTKPFSVEELLARIRVDVRRLQYIHENKESSSSVRRGLCSRSFRGEHPSRHGHRRISVLRRLLRHTPHSDRLSEERALEGEKAMSEICPHSVQSEFR